jgi:predicted HTH transcriptional regulator
MNTEALLADLAEALKSPEAHDDLGGIMESWAALVRGDVSPNDRFHLVAPASLPQPPRRRAILAEAAKGPVTSGSLATALHWDSETIRLDLRALVGAGILRRSGDKRGTKYTLIEVTA